MPPEIHPQRKRGGQPGNANARKVPLVQLVKELDLSTANFYAGSLRPAELDDLQRRRTGVLNEEILVLRILIRRLLDHADKFKYVDSVIRVSETIARVSLTIGRLVDIEHRVQPRLDHDRVMRALSETIEHGTPARRDEDDDDCEEEDGQPGDSPHENENAATSEGQGDPGPAIPFQLPETYAWLLNDPPQFPPKNCA